MSSVKKNYIYNVIYQLLTFASVLLITPYITRTLGAYNTGVYSYTYSAANYFWLFAMLGVNNYGNRSIAQARAMDEGTGGNEQVSRTFFNIYALQLLTAVVSAGAYITYVLAFSVDNREIALLQFLYVVAAVVDINWFFFGMEQFKITVTRNIVIKLLSMLAIFLLVKKQEDLWIYTTIMAGSILLSNLILLPYLRRFVKFVKPTWKEISRHVKPNLILFVPVVAISIYNIMDKLMIGRILGDKKEVSYYDNAEKVMQVPTAFINALGTVMLPKMSGLVQKNDKAKCLEYIEKSMQLALMISFATSFGLAAIADNFAPVFYGAEFIPCAALIMWLAPIGVIKSWANVIRTQYLIPNGKDSIYVVSVILGAVVNLIANLLLIVRIGTIGAVIGTILAEAAVMLYQTIMSRKELEFGKYLKRNIAYGGIGLVMFLVVRLIGSTGEPSVTLLLIQMGAGILIYGGLSAGYLCLTKDPFLNDARNRLNKILKKKK